MRHRKKRILELNTGVKKKDIVIRELLSNFMDNGKMTTTVKRAKVIKAEADKFLARLIEIDARFEDEKEARRECIRYIKSRIYGEEVGKKVINVLIPKYKEEKKTTSFVADYKIGYRIGDGAPTVMLKLL